LGRGFHDWHSSRRAAVEIGRDSEELANRRRCLPGQGLCLVSGGGDWYLGLLRKITGLLGGR
jgi:hypothetical protein